MSDGGVTGLLLDWSKGNRAALDTTLVNELYLRLIDQRQVSWRDRAHSFGVAAQIMRNILVDHARRRQSEKRGVRERTPLQETM